MRTVYPGQTTILCVCVFVWAQMLLIGVSVFEKHKGDIQITGLLVYLLIHCKQASLSFCDNSCFLLEWNVYDVLSSLQSHS